MPQAPRALVCLTCRRVVATRPCDGGTRHDVVAMDDQGRTRLAEEVWGPEKLKRQMRRVARGGATGGGIGILDACGGGDCGGCSGIEASGEAFAVVALIAAAIAIGALLAWGIYHLVRWILRKLERPRPQGAFAREPRLPPVKLSGRARRNVGSGLDESTALAWQLELRAKKVISGEKTMLIASGGPGFEVDLTDGRTVRIPPGPVYVYGAREEADHARARSVKRSVLGTDPEDASRGAASSGADGDPEQVPQDPLPFDDAFVTEIREGDVVEVYGELDAVADGSGGGAYRAPAFVLVPRGTPKIYRLGMRSLGTTLQPPTDSPGVRVAANDRTTEGASAYATSAAGVDGDRTSLASK